MQIAYIDGGRLRRALIAGLDHARASRAELNRINVFPVPDGDTGTNLALTARSISERLRRSRDLPLHAVAAAAAEAGVLGARGNCGMILSHFMLGFSQGVAGRARLSVGEFAAALREAVTHLYGALDRPVEGTIITVMRDVAESAVAAEGAAAADFQPLSEALLERARESLRHTPELLPVLKKAGVVDAGAKGFVAILEGIVRYVHGEAPTRDAACGGDDGDGAEDADGMADADGAADGSLAAGTPVAAALADFDGPSGVYRYCTEALVRGRSLPEEEAVRRELAGRGDSVIAIRAGDVLKVHIHTDAPDAVFDYLRRVGEMVAHKAEDMAAQHAAAERTAARHAGLVRRPVGVLTDSACDLPDEVVNAHGITVVPLTLVFDDGSLRDRVDITSATFAERLLAGAHPTTSQPAPAEFRAGFRRAAQDAEAIVAVLLGSTLSGTFASAEMAAKLYDAAPVRLVDSLGASLLQGLLVVKAAELAEAGEPPEAIAAELERVRRRSGILFTVESFDRLIASGRVTRGRALLGNLLDIRPILSLEPDGRVATLARVRGRGNLLPRIVAALRGRIGDARRVRFGVIHVAHPAVVDEVRGALDAEFGEREMLVSPATPVIATHIGPGAWGVAYMVEDGSSR